MSYDTFEEQDAPREPDDRDDAFWAIIEAAVEAARMQEGILAFPAMIEVIDRLIDVADRNIDVTHPDVYMPHAELPEP